MKQLKSLINYNLKLLFRDKGPVLMAFLMPIGFYILFGYMLKYLQVTGTSMTELLVPLYIIIIIGNAVISIFGSYYILAKESGNIQKYKFLGVSELKYALALFGATMVFQVTVIITYIIFTYFYAGVSFPLAQIIPVSLTILVIEVYHFAVTFLLIALLKRSTVYNSISLAFYMFQMFLGGLTFPIEMFPVFLQKLVYYINPIIYGRNALLGAWTGAMSGNELALNNGILLVVSAFMIVSAIALNRRSLSQRTATTIAA